MLPKLQGRKLPGEGRRRRAATLFSTFAYLSLATTAVAAPAGTEAVPALLDPTPPTLLSLEALEPTESALPAADVPVQLAATTLTRTLKKATWGGRLSGLPWSSGGTANPDGFEAYRGRRLDVRTGYATIKKGWAEVVQLAWVDQLVTPGSQPVMAVGLVPEAARGQLAQCAAGAFDAWIREVGRDLVAEKAGNAILRLGWEANRMGDFPWAVRVASDAGPFKGCFRRWVQVLRTVPGQSFTFDWNMGSQGDLPYHVDQIYPGNDFVDIIGAQYYDRCPPALTQADWDKRYVLKNATNGSPYGLGRWLAYAKSKGKRLSVPEWGIGGPTDACEKPGVDNPFFIEKMWQFFSANAGSIAYEAYFNGAMATGSHQLVPTTVNPLSSAKYRELWGPAT
jgi:hypothetical protein